ncbi:MAG: RlmE family RNA methyltransferase, partial [Candidatus Thermoplasmatota archaeon]|nr:RlmE family RNA methyltransferase [Candidatus Thermoplasmatota archaeon]
QVASEYIKPNGQVYAIDLEPIKPLERVITLQGDITDPQIFTILHQWLAGRKANVVLSDMSPDISGNYSVDQARSAWLCQQALFVAEKTLILSGHFVCKIFEGSDTQEVLSNIKHRFYIVKKFSPTASRKSSSEIYIVAKSLKKDD